VETQNVSIAKAILTKKNRAGGKEEKRYKKQTEND